jgi:hypothetical protein
MAAYNYRPERLRVPQVPPLGASFPDWTTEPPSPEWSSDVPTIKVELPGVYRCQARDGFLELVRVDEEGG